jgi:hypothetical protein
MKLSVFLESDIPSFLLGVFFSRRVFTEDNNYIYGYTYYKKSKLDTKVVDFKSYETEYINVLNSRSGDYPFWNTKNYFKNEHDIYLKGAKGQAFFVLENDISITKESLYNKLYSKLLSTCEWIFDDKLNDDKKEFIRGFMELRGSIDITANYIPHDYYADSTFELRKARMLIDYMNIPHYITNINFRELQHDYYAGIQKRNTQFRLNIWWYMENIGVLNAYKAEIFATSRNLPLVEPKDGVFYFNNIDIKNRTNINLLDERLNFYFTNLIDRDPSAEEIEKLRIELGFDGASTSIRKSSLVELIKNYTPDECVCCKNKYNIADRSHINPKTGKYYFEVHHVISLGNNKELDDENNMVKLCPACHRALKRGSSSIEEQKSMIKEIFKNAPKTYTFAKYFLDSNDFEKIVDEVQKRLN